MNILRHLKTVVLHKYHVFHFCCKFGIPWRGLIHDLSKLGLVELSLAKYANGNSSPINVDRNLNGRSLAWHHHKGTNRHHHEWWFDIREGHIYAIKPDWKDILEILADWLGAGIAYDGGVFDVHKPLRYFENRKDKHLMHPAMRRACEQFLQLLDRHGFQLAKGSLPEIKNNFHCFDKEPYLIY